MLDRRTRSSSYGTVAAGSVFRVACCAVVTLLTLANRAAADWFVVCDPASGSVTVEQSVGGREALAGPFPGERTANVWIDESCPGRRCAAGRGCVAAGEETRSADGWLAVCNLARGTVGLVRDKIPSGFVALKVTGEEAKPHAETAAAYAWVVRACPTWRCDERGSCAGSSAGSKPAAAGGGWAAGELTSVTLSGPDGAGAAPVASRSDPGPADPGGPGGPAPADLSPLIETAKAAAGACSFQASLMAAEQMTRFDPNDPWLAANLSNLRRLAERQRITEATVWEASSALSSGDLKRARKLAVTAANNAVSCQSSAVSELVRGIDAAIASDRQARAADRGRAVAALLPDLFDLARAVSATAAGTPVSAMGGAPPPPSGAAARVPAAGPDPCAFKYTYKNVWNVEPTCTCPGYRFEARQFRCVR